MEKKKSKNFRSKVNFHFLFGNKGKRSDDADGKEDFHDEGPKSKDDTDGKPKLISIKDIKDINHVLSVPHFTHHSGERSHDDVLGRRQAGRTGIRY